MDTEPRKRRLSEGLQANGQRRSRERYLASLPADLSDYLGKRECIFTPELDTFEHSWYPATEAGIGAEQTAPHNYRHSVYFWAEHALIVAGLAIRMTNWAHDTDQVILLPYMGCPGFHIEVGWARRHLVHLWPFSPQQLSIVAPDLYIGLVIDSYTTNSGDKNPNPEGVIFELAVWGPAA